MATSPAPDAAAPPGMCPGIAVLGGGGGSGDGGGDGSGGQDGTNGNGNGNGGNGSGDSKNGGEGCGDPICPITGRMFLDILDFAFGGPSPLRWQRHYSSRQSSMPGELGHGWAHAYGWRIRDSRRQTTELFDDQNRLQAFPKIPQTMEGVKNAIGWTLFREGQGFMLLTPDRTRRMFGPACSDGYHYLQSVSDKNGNAIRIERDARGVMTRVWDSAGRPYHIEVDGRRRITRILVAIDPAYQGWMEVARYSYDDDGDLIEFCDAEGFRWNYAYQDHLMIEHRIPTGLSYCYRYDGVTEDAYCVESWGEYIGATDPALELPLPLRPAGVDRRKIKGILQVTIDFAKNDRYCEVKNGLSGVVAYLGDKQGRVRKRVDAAGGISEYIYDPDTGDLIAETQPDGSTRVPSPTGPAVEGFLSSDGAKVSKFYDERKREVTFQEDFGAVVRRTFDIRGNTTFVLHADGTTEEFASDARGLLLHSVDRLGVSTHYEHDAMGNLILLQRTGMGPERMEYDYLGRKIAHVDHLGGRTEWVWDRRNEVIEKRYPGGGSTTWVRDGLRYATMTNHNGQVTRVTYGGLHWPIRIENPDGTTLEYRYDVMGNVVSIRNGRGDVCRQTYDYASRLVEIETFQGFKHTYAYDVAGEIVRRRGPTGDEVREFDSDGKLKKIELPDEVISLEYDLKNRTVSIDNGANGAPLVREYNAARNVQREVAGIHQLHVQWHGGNADSFVGDVGLPVRRTRGKTGELETIEAGDIATIFIEPEDKDGQVLYLGDRLVLRRTFTKNGQLAGTWLARRDDALQREQRATQADPGLISWATYFWRDDYLVSEYHSNGRSVEYDIAPGGRIQRRRVLDKGQVVEEENLRFDGAGTPLMAGALYDSLGRPIEIGGEIIEYDAAGRMCRRGDKKLRWSAAGELLEVESHDQLVRFRYDALGRRIAKRVYRQNEVVRDISYQWMNNCVLHEVDHTAQWTRTYLRDDRSFAPLGHVDSHGSEIDVCYYLRNPIGFPSGAVDPGGDMVWQAEPTLYGLPRPSVSKAFVDARFPNQHADPDVGLVYNHRRWFDPATGLFISPDPLLLDGNLHPLEYVRNPTIECDPSGLAPIINGLDHGRTSTDLCRPGPNATIGTAQIPGFIDAGRNAMDRNFSPDTHRAIDNAGFKYGCHSCGSKDPDPEKTGKYKHFIPDHQPPISQSKANGGNPPAGSVMLYPHCGRCSIAQRDQQNKLYWDPPTNAAAGATQQAANQAAPTPFPVPSRAEMQIQYNNIQASATTTPHNGWPANF
ncbi:DUF6531 domain-containing protein [Sorangium sp. So ce185]|uniref:DUF6531 domain-containing protein n=1 Tax=Sorangium sp. So ce185 TaxID=3133287 RepID=UPI003F60F4D3